ncbi:O-succinylbenzoate synthase [Escherichia coli]|uniref:o-succinylbenzoate synthase n=1 Tax=Escherichia coli TaxID=562 RepID=A0A377DPH7_ECOLX|nr:O-succinylbenzoate synthase [Escherichia coli]
MPNTLTRIIATASRFSKSRAKPAMIRERLPVKTGIAIAWDESLREPDFAFVAEEGVRAVVIKPTLTGSLEKVREQVQAAHALGLTAVISSSIESSLGLTQLARIAAWLTPDTIPGLDTLDLMQAQQVRRWPGSTLPVVEVDALERLL